MIVRAGLLMALFSVGACQGEVESGPRSKPHAPSTPPRQSESPAGQPLFALSTFAYAFTKEASDKTFEITKENSQLYVVQLDNGVPWSEALSGKAFPLDMRRKWETFKQHRPAGQPVYISIAPLDFDRMNIAGPPEGSHMPASIKNASFDSDKVKTAYVKYARRVVDYFEPDYLNLGIEAGELAHRRPSAWPAFARLIEYVMDDLHTDHPDLKIGISFGLQSLMQPAVANRVRDFVEQCDYLGLSFYPYMSKFHEKFGVAPLPGPPAQWREPLRWARDYTTKPIAICETGYNSKDASASGFGVHLQGSPELQRQYVEDLGRLARRDHHLFDVYYFPIDIDKMLAAMPDQGASGAILWRENGLMDSRLRPKPAWQAWLNILAGDHNQSSSNEDNQTAAPSAPVEAAPQSTSAQTVAAIGFSSKSDLFVSGSKGRISLQRHAGPGDADAMKWAYSQSRQSWRWAVRTLDIGAIAEASTLEFDVKSDRDGFLTIQLKERDGESYFQSIPTMKKWSHFSIKLHDLQLDPNTHKNGKFEQNKMNQIVLAIGGEHSHGAGAVWLANMIFSR